MSRSVRNNSVHSVAALSQASVVKSWATCIKGDPVTTRGKRVQKVKVLVLTMIPMVFLLGQNIAAMVVSTKQLSDAATLRANVLFSTKVGSVMHYLQTERGKTVLYVSSHGDKAIKEALQEAYIATDSAIGNLTEWPTPTKETKANMENKEVFHYYLKKHRQELKHDKTTIEKQIQFYSSVIDEMIGWILSNVKESAIGYIWKSLVAYQMLVLSKEQVGVERALGGVYFTTGSFKAYDHSWYVRKYHNGLTYMDRCLQYSVGICKVKYDSVYKNTALEVAITKMQAEILVNSKTAPSTVRAGHWFGNMSLYMNELKRIEDELSNFVTTTIMSDEADSQGQMTINAVILIFVLIISPFTVFLVLSIVLDIHTSATVLKEKSNELEAERMQTMQLLYQMLPRQVADKLRRREAIKPESYDCVTIFFSNIVGFAEFAAECAPLQGITAVQNLTDVQMVKTFTIGTRKSHFCTEGNYSLIQIVEILNAVYKVFDTRIEVYDAYKVQTIGDAYMVVSGCPERNGDNHIKEIGLMALDLLHSLQQEQMPIRIDGEGMKVRIGIHSGPCVTGVVGYTMPRYCLFGDTVYTASRIETSGLANKIQLSEQSYLLMDRHKMFDLEERGLVKLRGKGMVKTYWLKSVENDTNDSITRFQLPTSEDTT